MRNEGADGDEDVPEDDAAREDGAALEPRVLAAGLNRPVVFEYVGERARERTVHAVALRLEQYVTAKRGDLRVKMLCRDVEAGSRVKTFLTHRILSVVDSETGEVRDDVDGWLTWLVESVGGEVPAAWPAERIRVRDFGVTFGSDRKAEGWVFGVHEAFMAPLDIVVETVSYKEFGRQKWDRFRSQGRPPAYGFGAGMLLHAPSVPDAPWGEQRRLLTHSVQVVEAEPCVPIGRSVTAGRVVYDLWTYRGAETVRTRHDCTQAEFVALLREGVGPGRGGL